MDLHGILHGRSLLIRVASDFVLPAREVLGSAPKVRKIDLVSRIYARASSY